MEECLFCRIVRGVAAAERVYENHQAIAIMDINPIHYGHVLIIPRTHSPTFVEIPVNELPGVIEAVHVVAKAVVESLRPDGFNIFSNNGKAAGQSVFHFHLHVTPRYTGDNIQFILKLKKYSNSGMTEYAERIRQQIDHTH